MNNDRVVILSLVDPRTGDAESVECFDNPTNISVELNRFAAEHDLSVGQVEASCL